MGARRGDVLVASEDGKPAKKPRYFERPDAGEKPHTLWETFVIILSTHLGVRTKAQREEDFRRANGLHLFIAGIFYFALIIVGLIFLVRYVSK
jgi:hypothetical protein